MSSTTSQLPSEFGVHKEFLIEKLPYQDSLFVNREGELAPIIENIRKAQVGEVIAEPIVNLWGGTGVGKTWILHRLDSTYRYHNGKQLEIGSVRPTFTLLYSFSAEGTDISSGKMARALARDTSLQLFPALSRTELDQLTSCRGSGDNRDLAKSLIALTRRFVLLLLLDETEKLTDAEWLSLEQELLEPVVGTNRALAVVAGRKQVPRWRRFEVRRRVMDAHKSRVRPFDKSGVAKQLKQRKYDISPDLVYPYSGGNPHYVDAVSQNILQWLQDAGNLKPNQGWFDQRQKELSVILNLAVSQTLGTIPQGQREILEKISPLRFYRIEALRIMVQNEEERQQEQPDGYYLSILRDLETTEVVWWDRDRRSYMTGEVVRRLLNFRELLRNPALYVAKQRKAIQMYWQWAREFPRASDTFITEIWFHLACLYLHQQNVSAFRAEIREILLFAKEEIDTDHLMILSKQLDTKSGDQEIIDLVPESLQREWSRQIRELLEVKAKSWSVTAASRA